VISEGPKDHYLAQVFLRHFADEAGEVWVYDKQWGIGPETRSPAAICYERGGSDNHYFPKPRVIEDYLSEIENAWSSAVETLTSDWPAGSPDSYLRAKWIVSGYLAYLRLVSPAAVQAGVGLLETKLTKVYEQLKVTGQLPPPPPGLEHIVDLARPVVTDLKYPSAHGIAAVIDVRSKYYNSPWMIVEAPAGKSFITSDYPGIIWRAPASTGPYAFLAISPRNGVLVDGRSKAETGESYDHSLDGPGDARAEFVAEVNELVSKCAEKFVIGSGATDEGLRQAERWRHWRHRYQPPGSASSAGSWGPVDPRSEVQAPQPKLEVDGL
jgi:hypothetical protein